MAPSPHRLGNGQEFQAGGRRAPPPLQPASQPGDTGQQLSWAWAGTGIFLGWAPETLTLCGSLEGSSDCMPLAGMCVVLKVDLGSGGDPDMNLGRKTPHHIPEGGWGAPAPFTFQGPQNIQ